MKLNSRMLILIATALIVAGCAKEEPAATGDQKAEPESRVHRGADGAGVITLDLETQARLGLQVMALTGQQLSAEQKAFGRVVDPAPLAEMLLQFRRAQLAFDTAHAELERMKVLRKDENTSARAFEAAEAAYLQNQTDLATIMFNVEKTFGRKVVELLGPMVVPPGTERTPNRLLGELGEQNALLVRVDLPASEAPESTPLSARIVGAPEDSKPVAAQFFGEVPALEPQSQTRGYFFLIATPQPRLVPGLAVTAFLELDGAAQSGVVVPGAAVIRNSGATYVYATTDGTNFSRRAIALGPLLDQGWFVPSGLAVGTRVVTTGAQSLFSEELNGSGFTSGGRD